MRAKDAWLFHTCDKELPLVAGHLYDEDIETYSPPESYDHVSDVQVDATPYYFKQMEQVFDKARQMLTEDEYARLVEQVRVHLD